MLYTRKGDQGTTKIINSPERISKCSSVIEALGSIDELNSFLGLCRAKSKDLVLKIGERDFILSEITLEIQENLFTIQAILAGADKKITLDKIQKIEFWVDEVEKHIPPIKSFLIAGGTELSAFYDIGRTLVRKAERGVVRAVDEKMAPADPEMLSYLNRLSSLLYAIVRAINHEAQIEEKKPSYH